MIQMLPVRGLAFALAVAPALSVFLPRGIAALFALTVVTALPVLSGARDLRWPPRPVVWALAGFHAWQLLSVLWCLEPAQAMRSTLGVIGLSLGGAVVLAAVGALPERSLRLLLRAAAIGVLVGGVVFVVEAVWGLAIREFLHPLLTGKPYTALLVPQRLSRASTVIAIMALPVGYGFLMARRWFWLAAVAAVAAGTVVLSPSSTSKICLILGPMVVAASWLAARPLAVIVRAVVAMVVISAPFVMDSLPDTQALWNRYPGISHSAHHRLSIWKFSAERVMEKPVLGWGMDASRAIPGGEDQKQVFPPMAGADAYHEQNLPLHPHNTALQWWLELGGVGAALGLGVLLAMIGAFQRLPRPDRAVALGIFVQAVVVALISFGAWQAWWLAVLWLMPVPVMAAARLRPRG